MGMLSSGRLYKQKAVYWEKTEDVDDHGQPLYAEPVVIKCRWEDRTQQFLDAQGGTQISRSVVYVPFDLKLEAVLWLSSQKVTAEDAAVMAELTSWVIAQGGTGDLNEPDEIPNAWEIRRFDKIPDFKNKNTLRIAIL